MNNISATAAGCPDCSTLQVKDSSLLLADLSKVPGLNPQGPMCFFVGSWHLRVFSQDTPAPRVKRQHALGAMDELASSMDGWMDGRTVTDGSFFWPLGQSLNGNSCYRRHIYPSQRDVTGCA